MLKRLIAVVALASMVASCATFKNPISPNSLAVAEAGYGAVLSVAVNYKRACIAKMIPPSCRGIVTRLQPYQAKAQTAIVLARKLAASGDTLTSVSAVIAAQGAIDAFKSAAKANGVK